MACVKNVFSGDWHRFILLIPRPIAPTIVQIPFFPRPRSLSVLLLCVAFLCTILVGPAWAQPKPAQPEEAFNEAYRFYSGHYYDQAIGRFATFQRDYPDHILVPEALYYQAESALALERTGQAVTLLDRFRKRYPNHPLAYRAGLALGQYFFETASYERALTTLSEALADEPPAETAATMLYWMGASAQHLGRADEALSYYQRAADNYPATETAPLARYAIAHARLEARQYDEAARAFELLAAQHPQASFNQTIGLTLAMIYYQLGDYQRAVQEVQRRMPQLDPQVQDQAVFLMAEAYNQLRESENAIQYYRRLTESNPAGPFYRRALYGLGWNYYQENTFQWAAEHFARAAEGQDDELALRATYYEAVNWMLATQPERALQGFEAVTRRWPQSDLAPQASYEAGMVLYALRRWEEAHEAFSRLLKEYPNASLRGEALRQRGYTAIARNDFEAAFKDFDEALALHAVSQQLIDDILFQKAWLLYRTEAFEASATAFWDLYQQDPKASKADEALFWAAESFFQIDQFERSLRLFNQYLRTFPGGKQVEAAHYAIGWGHFKMGRYDDAITAFNTFLDRYRDTSDFVPYRTDAQLRLADSYYALKRYREAIQRYQRVADDGEDYAFYQLAQARSHLGNTREAIQTFQELLLKYPESPWREEALYTVGYLFFQNQDYAEAIRHYEQFLGSYPRDPLAAKAQYGMADARFNQGQLEEAVQNYLLVLEKYPQSVFAGDAAEGIQYALIGLEDEARAEALITAFIEKNPTSPLVPELRFRQAEVLVHSGRQDEALVALQRFVNAYGNTPQATDARYYLGTIYAEKGRLSEAEAALQRAANTAGSRQADARWRLARLMLEQERYQESLAQYEKLAAMPGQDPLVTAQARYGQSQALLALGRTEEAEALLRQAAQAAPDAPEAQPALLGLGRLFEQDGRHAEALRLYRQVADKSREEAGAEALFRLGDLLHRQGEARAAIEELSRLPVLFAGFPEWLAQGFLVQARAFQSLGQTGDALRMYDRVIEEYPDTAYARDAAREKASL